ncbi:cyclin-domain-containing protein [Dichotomocladium elegans]|nr:cyclin-domain-containing protein [Dichotomocladium elegans]
MASAPPEAAKTDVTVIQVPEYFYAIDINYLIHMIADMLGRLISHNDLIPLTSSNITRFHSRMPPNISLNDYLRRIVKYAPVEKACLLVLLIYIDRICERHPHFTISSLTVHRFLITAVTVSSKSLCDSYCTNSHYAKVGGISTQELNQLELEFLKLIDWDLSSSGAMLQQYYARLILQHPCYERVRGEREQRVNQEKDSIDSDQKVETKQTGKRRRSSTLFAEQAAAATAAAASLPSSPPLGTMDGTEEETQEDKDEKEETVRHFDTLLQRDWIPYIA